MLVGQVVPQHVFTQAVRAGDKYPSLIEPRHLVDKAGKKRGAFKHKGIYDYALGGTGPHFLHCFLQGPQAGWILEIHLVPFQVSGRFAVRHQYYFLITAVLLGQQFSGQSQGILVIGTLLSST